MRKMVAALQMSLDGFAQGSDEMGPEWVDTWTAGLALIPDVDTFVQGAGMYPGYAMFWSAIEANPNAVPPFSSRLPYESEVAYAQRAAKTPHYVLSTKLDSVPWPPSATIVRDLDALKKLKQQPGGNIYVVGGPSFVNALLQADLLDELKLIVAPVLLGGGKPMFSAGYRKLKHVGTTPHEQGRVVLSYAT